MSLDMFQQCEVCGEELVYCQYCNRRYCGECTYSNDFCLDCVDRAEADDFLEDCLVDIYPEDCLDD